MDAFKWLNLNYRTHVWVPKTIVYIRDSLYFPCLLCFPRICLNRSLHLKVIIDYKIKIQKTHTYTQKPIPEVQTMPDGI